MNTRMDYRKYGSGAIKAMYGLATYLQDCGLEKSLLHLVYLRASQMNECAFCVDMHTDEALADGENPARLHLLSVWRETPLFSEREQGALAWTEAGTRVIGGGPSDELAAKPRAHFSEQELWSLTVAVVAI